jgi:hypothetical protein
MPRNEQVVLAFFLNQDINYFCIHFVSLVSYICGCGFGLYDPLILQFMLLPLLIKISIQTVFDSRQNERRVKLRKLQK